MTRQKRLPPLYKHTHCIACGMPAVAPTPLYPRNYVEMVGGIYHYNYTFPTCFACSAIAWRKIPEFSHPSNFWDKIAWLTEQALASKRPTDRDMQLLLAPIAEAALHRTDATSRSVLNDAMTNIGIDDFLDSLPSKKDGNN